MNDETETPPPIDAAEQAYSDFVAAYQDALEAGRPLPDPGRLPASFASRWRRTRTLLHGLDRFAGNSGAADSSEPGTPRTYEDTPLESSVTGMPDRFGRYEPGEILGRGGMGIVHEAFDPFLGRTVALKIIRPERVADAGGRLRFEREAKFLAKLDHPHIVRVYEAGLEGEWPYLAMELVAGPSLHRMVDGKPMPAKRAAEIAAVLADGVAHAHALGVLHRDLKPGNVLLRGGTEPCITDFGLAAPLENAFGLTATDELVGTPNYLAPEMVLRPRDGASPAVDVYGLGAILYECLTGRPPFNGQALHAILWQVVNVDPVSPRLLMPDVPADLETICLKCLGKDPKRRYPEAAALADDLRRFTRGEAILARPAGRRERTTRWARRNPALAASWALTYVIGLALLATALVYNRRLQAERDNARTSATEALEARGQAERRAIDLSVSLAREAPEPQLGALWFAEAARQAGDGGGGIVEHWRGYAAAAPRPWAVFRVPEGTKSLLMHPAGRWLATANADGWKLWDAAGGSEVPLPGRPPATFQWSEDGHWLATGAPDGKTVLRKFPVLEPHREWNMEGRSRFLAFDRTGGKLAMGNTAARVFDLKADAFDPPGPLPVGDIVAIRFHPQGGKLIATSTDGKLSVLDVSNPGEAVVRVGPLASRAPEPHANGDQMPGLLATGRFFTETPQQMEMRKSDGTHAGTAWISDVNQRSAVIIGPDGMKFAMRHPNRPVVLWDAVRGPMSFPRIAPVADQVSFSPDGGRFVLSTRNGLELWRTDGAPLGVTLAHDGPPAAVACSAEGRWLASLHNGVVRVWRGREQARRAYDQRTSMVSSGLPVASPDGRSFMAAGREPRTIQRYDARSGEPIGAAWPFAGQTMDAAFAADGETVYSVAEAGMGGKLATHPPEGRPAAFEPIALSFKPVGIDAAPDGLKLAVVGDGGRVELRSATDGALLGQATLADKQFNRLHPAHRVRFAPDGKTFATFGIGHTIEILDAADAKSLHSLKADQVCTGIAFSPDGRTLAAIDDARLRLWNLATGEPARADLVHPNGIEAVAYQPKGNLLLTACRDGTVRLWDAGDGCTLKRELPHPRAATAAAFSPDGTRIAVVQAGQRVRLWETDTGVPLAPDWPLLGEDDPIPPHPGWVAFLDDGKSLLAGVRFLKMWLFDLDAAFAAPPTGGIGEIVRLAELDAGQVLKPDGIVEAIPLVDWLKRWSDFRSRHPDYHRWPER